MMCLSKADQRRLCFRRTDSATQASVTIFGLILRSVTHHPCEEPRGAPAIIVALVPAVAISVAL
jgi:hypothetical protein